MDNFNTKSGDLLEQALRALQELLGEGWDVTELPQPDRLRTGDAVIDSRIQITPPDRQRSAELLVITQAALTPRDVETRLRQINNVLHHTRGQQTLLVTAPWISARTQQALRDQEIAYLDLTGNASISVSYPSIRIQTQGATKSPKSPAAADSPRTITLSGVQAGRVVRFLADRRPPYQASQIADVTGVGLPRISRLLGLLGDQLLIRRSGRKITEVKWPDILRARAETYDLLRHNSYVSTVAINGAATVLNALAKELKSGSSMGRVAVTGSYAARAVAPHTVGGQLMLYVEPGPGSHTPDAWADRLGLLRADRGDVLLLHAYDEVVFEGTRELHGVPHVALSQLVLDSLSGPGRMPAEAEKVLEYMIDHESDWRSPLSSDRG